MSNKFEAFGKYILLEKLATGGMAEVFLSRGNGVGGIAKFFAIKRILPQYADSPEFIDMFKDEAKIAINLSHSNIVSIHEFGVQNKQFFLVMDYVEGRNLRQILNKMKKSAAKFSLDQIVFIIKEVAAGLDHAHRCLDSTTGKPLNITHRDMSPQNVMISFEGEVKIVDFGIAKAESQLETTRAGTLKGKFGYMSPEQAEGQQVDLRTDIFSLGIVLWELLADDRLFIANNEINTLRKIRDCQIPSLRKINPNIHAELERITQKALARDRNLRYQTAAALHRDLNRFLNRQYPDFSPHDFSVFIKTLFADEILGTRKRLIDYSKITVKPSSSSEDNHDNDDSAASISLSGTQTSSLVTPAAPGSETATKTPSENTFSTGDIQFSDGKSKTLLPPTLRSKDALESSGSNHTPVAPQLPNSFQVLDEKALTREMHRDIKVVVSNPYTIETEEAGTGSLSKYTNYNVSPYDSPAQKKSGSQQFLTFMLATLFAFSVYCYLAKNYTSAMAPIIRLTDPVLKPVHNTLGISGIIERASKSPTAEDSNTQPQPTLIDESTSPPAEPQTTSTPAPAPTPSPTLTAPTPPQAAALVGVVISSTPSGAEIYIDNRNTGFITPSRVEVPADRNFLISIKRNGYIDYHQSRSVKDIKSHKFSATLQKALVGYLDIDVTPSRVAVITVNDKELRGERLPITRYAVPANTPLTIRAENPITGAREERLIRVSPEQRQRIVFDLKRAKGRNPSRAN